MPLYEFSCPACGADFELLLKKPQAALDCLNCGKTAGKKISVPSHFEYQGSGVADNDYPSEDRSIGRDADFRRGINFMRQQAKTEIRLANKAFPLFRLFDTTPKQATQPATYENLPSKDQLLAEYAPLDKDLISRRDRVFDEAQTKGLFQNMQDELDTI